MGWSRRFYLDLVFTLSIGSKAVTALCFIGDISILVKVLYTRVG